MTKSYLPKLILQMEVHIDKKTGSYIFIQFVDGKPCPYVITDSTIAKRYAALQLIKKDLSMAKAAIHELQTTAPSQLVKVSLLSFAIISYGRCFTDAQGRGTKLNVKNIFKENSPLLAEHNRLMSMRHSYVAHAGVGDFETAPVSITLNPDLNNKQILGHTINAMTQINQDIFYDAYLKVMEFVLTVVEDLIVKTQNKFDDELSKLDIEQLYKDAVTATFSIPMKTDRLKY